MQERGREDPCLRRFLARGEGGGSITLEQSNIECLALGCSGLFQALKYLDENIKCILFVLPLKDINYDLSIINLSQIVIMRKPCCYKVLVFISVAILLLIDFTNFAKADNYGDKDYNYDRHQYPDYQSSTYSFLSHLYRLILLPFLRSSRFCGLKQVQGLKTFFFSSCHVRA